MSLSGDYNVFTPMFGIRAQLFTLRCVLRYIYIFFNETSWESAVAASATMSSPHVSFSVEAAAYGVSAHARSGCSHRMRDD